MAELNTSEKSGSGTSKRMNLHVDLTAMVDLAFLLITFFMLTTSLSKTTMMNVAMPVADVDGGVKKSQTLTLCLGAANQIFWYTGTNEKPDEFAKTDFSRNGIRDVLINRSKEVLAKTGKKLMVLIKPSDRSQYKDLVDVLDELNITQIPSYAIVDISKEDVSKLKDQGIY
ncbi:ExbD/TolR family protein [Pedobacter alpinus]|uniref:ExbD/TolR family protein n=1 Tax=Pedobacter alpinus TaxID=1590643 RepID=A0ABW5TNG0_9SPHI